MARFATVVALALVLCGCGGGGGGSFASNGECRLPLVDNEYLENAYKEAFSDESATEEEREREIEESLRMPPYPEGATGYQPNDPLLADDDNKDAWPLKRIAARGAWALTKGDENVVVALLDSGVKADHPDLAGRIVAGYDIVNDDGDPNDDCGHGTAMAGLIAANIDNGIGSAGIAPMCKVVPIKIADKAGYILLEDLAKGIRYAADHGVDIICIPGGIAEGDKGLREAVRYAAGKGILMVASAGSNETTQGEYPAAYGEAMEVAGTEGRDIPARFCAISAKAEVAAPAEGNMYTTWLDGEHGRGEGTSAACVLTAGACALVKSANKNLTGDQIRRIVRLNGDEIPILGFREFYKARRLNIYQAVKSAQGTGGGGKIMGVEFIPKAPKKGEGMKVKVRFANSGLREIKELRFHAELTLNEGERSVESGESAVWGIAGLAEGEATIEMKAPAKAGEYKLIVKLKEGADILKEEIHGPVKVEEKDLPDLEVIALNLSELDADEGEVEIGMRIRNRGNAMVKGGCVGVGVSDGSSWHEDFQGVLRVGEEREFRFVWKKPPVEKRKVTYGIAALVAPAEGEVSILDNKMIHNFRLLDQMGVGRVAYIDLPGHEIMIDAPWMVCQGDFVPVLMQVGNATGKHSFKGIRNATTRTELAEIYIHNDALGSRFPENWLADPDNIFFDGSGNIKPRTKDGSYAIVTSEGDVMEENDKGFDFFVGDEKNPKLKTSPVELDTVHKIVRIPTSVLKRTKEDNKDVAYIGVNVLYKHLITSRMDLSEMRSAGFSKFGSYVRYYWLNKSNGVIFEWKKMLRVEMHSSPLPTLESIDRHYDAHLHTISEYTTSESMIAPRQAHGGSLEMLVECAYVMGMIEGVERGSGIKSPTLLSKESRNKIITTDHNVFYSDEESPHVGPTADAGKDEINVMRDEERAIGKTAGEEIGLKWKEGLEKVGRHMLAYEAPHIDGPWHSGALPVAKRGLGLSPNNPNTIKSVLSTIAQVNEAWTFAAHPLLGADDKYVWEEGMLRESLSLEPRTRAYVKRDGSNFVFKGLQMWNQRQTMRLANTMRKDIPSLNPFYLDGKEQRWVDESWDYSNLFLKGIAAWEKYVREGLTYRFGDEKVVFPRKIYILAGTDSHGDFNYWEGHDSSVAPEHIPGLLDNYPLIGDAAFAKARTYAFVANGGGRRHGYIDPFEENETTSETKEKGYLGFKRLSNGRCVVTDGPVLEFQSDAQSYFDSERMVWIEPGYQTTDSNDSPFNPDGRIGGRGNFDGGFTLLLPISPEKLLPIRYRWNGNPEDGGSLEEIRFKIIHRKGLLQGLLDIPAEQGTPPGPPAGGGLPGGQPIPPPDPNIVPKSFFGNGGGADEGWLERDIKLEGLPSARDDVNSAIGFEPFAIYLYGYTDKTAQPREKGHMCYTNPVWVAPVEIGVTAGNGALSEGGDYISAEISADFSFSTSMKGGEVEVEIQTLSGTKSVSATAVSLGKGVWSDLFWKTNSRYRITQTVNIPVVDPATGKRLVAGNTVTCVIYMKNPRDANGNLLNAIAKKFTITVQ